MVCILISTQCIYTYIFIVYCRVYTVQQETGDTIKEDCEQRFTMVQDVDDWDEYSDQSRC